MTEKKLTPRVGDRVLVELDGEYSTGRVVKAAPGIPPKWHIELDIPVGQWKAFDEGSRVHNRANITVLGREPVEWPEGWSLDDRDLELISVADYMNGARARFISLPALRRILAEGPWVVEHWRQLVGGDS